MADSGKKQSRFDLIVGAVDKLSTPFKAINNTIARNTEGIKRLKTSVSALHRETGFSTLSKSAGGALAGIRNVGAESRNLVGTISGAVGKLSLVLGGTTGGFMALAHSTAAAGDAAAKASRRAGVATQTWQEYAYAASLSDVSNEQLEKSFIKIQDTAIKAFKGDKSARAALKDMGIAFKNANGEVRNADNLFMDVAKKVQELNAAGKEAQATNLVKNLFGEEGTKLMPLLASGANGLRDMRREAHALGVVLSGEDAKASEEFNDSVTRMKAALKGVGFTVGRELIPFFTEIAQKVTAWTAANRELIGVKFGEFMQKIRENLPNIIAGFTAVVGGVQRFIEVADSMAQSVGGWENVLKGVGVLLGGKLLLAVGLATKAFIGFGAAMLATPIGWIIGGIAAVAGGAALIYKNWDGIKEWFANLWESIIGGIRSFTDKLPDWLKKGIGIVSPVAGAVMGTNLGAEVGAESVAREVSESRTTVTERQETTVRLKLDERLIAETEGGASGVQKTYDGFDVGSQAGAY